MIDKSKEKSSPEQVLENMLNLRNLIRHNLNQALKQKKANEFYIKELKDSLEMANRCIEEYKLEFFNKNNGGGK